jgi:hypothetical protein
VNAPTDPPPCDVALEREVLGAAFLSSDLARQVVELPPELFVLGKHRELVQILASVVPDLNGAPPIRRSCWLWRAAWDLRPILCS